MKKVFKTMAFTLLGLVLSVNLWAVDETVTFTFSATDKLQGWTSNPAPSSCETANTARGLAWSKTAITSFSYTLSDYGVSKVSIVASANATGYTLFVNGGTGQAVAQSNLATYDFDVSVAKGGTITISTTKGSNVKSFWIKSITLTKASGDTPSGPTLESIYFTDDAATKLSYTEGDVFDPAGLVVMGKYSEGEDKPVTDKVEWSFDPETLAATTTSVTVTASIDDVEDAQKTVNGITVASAPKFTKVTSDKTDWSGEYLLVYENEGTAYVWTGIDAVNSYATATITSNQIAKPADAVTLTIESVTGGYAVKINGGDNNGKYMGNTKQKSNAADNGFSISDTKSTDAGFLTSITFSDGAAKVAVNKNGETSLRFNSASDQKRFRYYKSGQQAVQLYEKVLAPTNEAVTFAAPEGGSLVIKNDATPINSGTTIQNGTILDVTFGMTPAEAYTDVAIKVTKTEGGDDVTSTVYNSETQKITMPRYPITVSVTFTKLYAISVATAGEGEGTATINGGTSTIYVSEDDEITLVAEPAAGSEFGGWTASNENIIFDNASSASTTALAGAAGTITATFGVSALLPLDAPTLSAPTNITYNSVTLNWQELANADGGYHVEIWLDDVRVVYESGIGETYWTPDFTFQANTEYTYTVQGIGDGSTYAEENNPKATSTFTTDDYPAVVLTLNENGSTSTKDGKLNTAITLPTTSTQACDGKVFVGWSENPIEGEVGKDQVTLLGETYTFTDPAVLEKTIYAVYAKKVEGDKYFEKVSSAPSDWCGKYLIVYEAGNLAMDGSLETLDAVGNSKPVTISDSKIAWSQDMENISFTIAYKTGSSTVYSLKSARGKYISGTTTSAVAANGIKQADTDANYEINFDGLTLQSKSSDQQMVLKYNDAKDQTRFRFYKSGQKAIAMYKYSATIDYSNYCTTCEAAVAAPTFSLAEGNYDEAKKLTLTATEGDIYYTINGGAETLYEEAIALNNRGTYEISAYAKVDDRTSDVVTKTYTLDWAYTLAELVDEGAPTTDGRTVTVILTNEVIESLATSGSYVNGFFTMVGDKKIEVYCQNSPAEWEVGGKVSGTVTCPWKDYKGTWELCPTNWNWASYTAPAKITSLVITNDVTNKNYTAGQKLDFTGLTVTGVYSDATEEDVTADVDWTEVTLTQGQVSATATATLNNVETGNKDVSKSIEITGLTVGAAKTLESIYVDNEHSTHKKAFFVGRPFSAEGLKVMAHYNIGDDQQIALANLTIDNPTFSAAEAEHTINISYTENEVEKNTSYKVAVSYMNLSDLVAEDLPEAGTSVKVSFSNVEITGFYKNSSDKRAGVYVNVIGKNDKNIELYSGGTPSETLNGWQEGGKLASKGDYITGTWKYYDGGSVWEIDFGSAYAWSTNIEYTAPEIYPTEISMSIPTATVKQSKSLDLEANFTPANATVLNNLAWESDNAKVTVVPSQDKKSAKVTVAPDATVGTATITVKVDDKDGNKLSATCVITIQEYSVPHYGLYTGDITKGDYIFKADREYYYMNNTNNNGRLANVANENKPEIVNNIITTDAETYVWQIAKSGDYWTIKNLATQTYVISTASGKASLSDSPSDNTEKWTITYDETKEVYTFVNLGRTESTSESDRCNLRNNNTSGWACYTATTGNAITLYKAGFTPAAALTSIEIDATSDVLTKEYIQGATFSTIGLKVLGNYSDLTKSEITSGITWTVEPSVLNETGDNISVTVTAHAKGFDSESRVITGIKVSEPAQEHVYGFFNFMDNGPDITDWEETSAWSTTYTTHDVVADEATVHFEGAAKQTSTITNMPVVKQAAIVLELTEEDKQITSVILATAKWSSKSKKITAAVSLDGENYTDLEVEGNETDGLSTAITQNGIRYVKFIPENNDNQLGIATLTFTIADIQYDYFRNDLVVGNYGTVCVPYTVTAADRQGATFWSIETSNAPGYAAPTSVTIVEETNDLVAGKPYIFCATDTKMALFFSGDKYEGTESVEANGLYGNLTEETITINDQNDPNAGPEPTRGFFFVLQQKLYECGWNCTVAPNRGWVQAAAIEDMTTPSPAPRRVIGNPNGTPTNLNGLNGNVKAQKALIDGHIYIIRDNKMYNAQGLFVK